MKITIDTQVLAEEVRRVARVTAEKGALPVLGNVLLRAEGELLLAATDLQVGLVTRCPAVIEEMGRMTLPAKKLLEMLEQLPAGELTITEARGVARLAAGSFRSRLQALPAEDFPDLPTPGGAPAALPALPFRAMLDRTSYAVSDKGSATTYALKGSLLSIFGEAFALVATDGKRLSIATASCPKADPLSVIIPDRTLGLLVGHAEGRELVFQTDGKHLFFSAGPRLLYSQMLDATFPSYERIIPRDTTIRIGIGRLALEAALRRVGVVAEEDRAVRFVVTETHCTVSAQSRTLGDAEEIIEASSNCPEFTFMINSRYVLDFLEHAEQPTITIDTKTGGAPLLFTDGPDFVNVIMGMRVS